MEQKLTYSKAFDELETILTEMQSDSVPIDKLSQKVIRTRELLKFCKEQLRRAQKEIDELEEE